MNNRLFLEAHFARASRPICNTVELTLNPNPCRIYTAIELSKMPYSQMMSYIAKQEHFAELEMKMNERDRLLLAALKDGAGPVLMVLAKRRYGILSGLRIDLRTLRTLLAAGFLTVPGGSV